MASCDHCDQEAREVHHACAHAPHAAHMSICMRDVAQEMSQHMHHWVTIAVKRKREEADLENVLDEDDLFEERPVKREADTQRRHLLELNSGMLLYAVTELIDRIDLINDGVEPLLPAQLVEENEVDRLLNEEISLQFETMAEELRSRYYHIRQKQMVLEPTEEQRTLWDREQHDLQDRILLLREVMENGVQRLEITRLAQQWFWRQLALKLFGPERSRAPHLDDPIEHPELFMETAIQTAEWAQPEGWRAHFFDLYRKSGRLTEVHLASMENHVNPVTQSLIDKHGARALFHIPENYAFPVHVLLRQRPWFVNIATGHIYYLNSSFPMRVIKTEDEGEAEAESSKRRRITRLRRTPKYDYIFTVVDVGDKPIVRGENHCRLSKGQTGVELYWIHSDQLLLHDTLSRRWSYDALHKSLTLDERTETRTSFGIEIGGITTVTPVGKLLDATETDGNLWLLFENNQLKRLDGYTSRLEDYRIERMIQALNERGFPDRRAVSLSLRSDFVATVLDDGSFMLQFQNWRMPRIHEIKPTDVGIEREGVFDLLDEPNLNISLLYGHSYYFSPGYPQFVKVRHFTTDTIVLMEKDGTVWAWGPGLFQYTTRYIQLDWHMERRKGISTPFPDTSDMIYVFKNHRLYHKYELPDETLQAQIEKDLQFTMRPYKLDLLPDMHGNYHALDWSMSAGYGNVHNYLLTL